jgi:hypothetical protein
VTIQVPPGHVYRTKIKYRDGTTQALPDVKEYAHKDGWIDIRDALGQLLLVRADEVLSVSRWDVPEPTTSDSA